MAEDIIVPGGRVLSLDEARHAKEAKPGEEDEGELFGPVALKRTANKEFVIVTATKIATELCRKTYNAMGDQQAEAFGKLEFMCEQLVRTEVTRLREEVEARSLLGRCRRLFARLADWLSEERSPRPFRELTLPVGPDESLGTTIRAPEALAGAEAGAFDATVRETLECGAKYGVGGISRCRFPVGHAGPHAWEVTRG